ncbi:MAG: hypothetical protein ACYC6L_01455 [Anaerolineae bacterium]
MRILTLSEKRILYVRNQPTTMDNLDRDLDILIEQLQEARAVAGIPQARPLVTCHYPAEGRVVAT